MSGSQANKAIVRRYFEKFNSGDMNQLADIVSEDYGDGLKALSKHAEDLSQSAAGAPVKP
jgi:hypothetical protein